MWRLRLPERFPTGAISSVNALDVPAERIIAEGRVVLVALLLFAVVFDPDPLVPHGTGEFKALVAYAGVAIALAVTRVWRFPARPIGLAVHALDIISLLLLSVLADTRDGLFFAFFTFCVLLAASLRWNWQAVLATAVIIALIFWLGGTIQTFRTGQPGEGSVVVGATYVLIAGAMLAYSSAVRERRREQLARLTEWPGPDPSQLRRPNLASLLGHCANALETPRVLVLWEEAEEPFISIAMWRNGEYSHARQMAGSYGNFVRSEQHAESAFWTDDATSTFASTLDGPIRLEEPIIDDTLIHAFAIGSVASAPFTGALCKGRVFVLDRQRWSDFQLQLVDIVASRLGNALDREIMQGQAREAIAELERARLIRDLHDGLLQSLTAAGLQIKLVSDGENPETQRRLEVVRQLLVNEQRRIREAMGKTALRNEREREVPLKTYLQNVVADAAKHWNCKTSLKVNPPEAMANATLCVHLSLMLGEAIANAVRHGRASMVRVSIEKSSQDVTLHICDNGHGFHGVSFSYDTEDPASAGSAPLSLQDRVSELGGRMGVKSSSEGVELLIKLPLT
jgi:signal transduction histidine kinase